MTLNQLETPVVIINLDRLETNMARLQAYLDQHGIANRPHIKTHKIPAIAHMQVNGGAVGITCQKVSEAEVMAEAGIQDILVTYNVMGESKLQRLMRLAKQVQMSVIADSAYTVRGLSAAAKSSDAQLTVLVEFDSGGNRCGVQSPREAADLARLIASSPGLHFGGLMTYPNTDQLDPFVRETKSLLAKDGITVERVSGGGTSRMWQAHTHQELTEHRAGMYIYGDRYTLRAGAMQLDDIALHVLTTVVSRPTADRGILDGGSKTFSSDMPSLDGYGYILEYPQARIYQLSEEHGHVDFSECPEKPDVGERVTVIPNHCCPVTNLFDEVIGIRDDKVEVVWEVAARGTVK